MDRARISRLSHNYGFVSWMSCAARAGVSLPPPGHPPARVSPSDSDSAQATATHRADRVSKRDENRAGERWRSLQRVHSLRDEYTVQRRSIWVALRPGSFAHTHAHTLATGRGLPGCAL